ncbi:hypothetical protein [Taklimakanibacter deserti]|uniref:hypothetical protein n=1 Tax=Taklimakanibacter deserti TaxID=2267839 RepID=UPI000E646BB1
MTRPPPLPDLDSLSSAEKDALIVSLWQAIDAMETAGSIRPAPSDATELRSRISRAEPARRAKEQARTGLKAKLFKARYGLGLLAVIAIGFAADFAIGAYQAHALALRRQEARALENAAFAGLFVELTDVAYEPDGKSYRARLTLQNTNPAAPLYIMLDPARVFVQAGLTWQGVSTEAGSRARVVKLDGSEDIQVVFQADIANWTELMPGYMHVRIENPMLISRSSEPTDDLVERANRFYVYLKPQGSDDAAIRKRMNFPGAPPIFIPMPPH